MKKNATLTDDLGPVLELVRSQSVPEMDPCREEILRQAQDQYPPLPTSIDRPASLSAWSTSMREAS